MPVPWDRPGRVVEVTPAEVQLYMWTWVLENVVEKLAYGRMRAGVEIETAVVDV